MKKFIIAIDSDLDKDHLLLQKTYSGLGGMSFLNYVTVLIFEDYFACDRKSENNIEKSKLAFKIFEILYTLDLSEFLDYIILNNYNISNDMAIINFQKKYFKMTLLLIKKTNYYKGRLESFRLAKFFKAGFLIFSKFENTFLPIFLDEVSNMDISLLKNFFNFPNRIVLRNILKTRYIKKYFISAFTKHLKFLLFDLLYMKEYYSLKLLIDFEFEQNGSSQLINIKNDTGRNLLEELMNHRGVTKKFLHYLLSKTNSFDTKNN